MTTMNDQRKRDEDKWEKQKEHRRKGEEEWEKRQKQREEEWDKRREQRRKEEEEEREREIKRKDEESQQDLSFGYNDPDMSVELFDYSTPVKSPHVSFTIGYSPKKTPVPVEVRYYMYYYYSIVHLCFFFPSIVRS